MNVKILLLQVVIAEEVALPSRGSRKFTSDNEHLVDGSWSLERTERRSASKELPSSRGRGNRRSDFNIPEPEFASSVLSPVTQQLTSPRRSQSRTRQEPEEYANTQTRDSLNPEEPQRIRSRTKTETEEPQRTQTRTRKVSEKPQRTQSRTRSETEEPQRIQSRTRTEPEEPQRIQSRTRSEPEEPQRIQSRTRSEPEEPQRIQSRTRSESEEPQRIQSRIRAEPSKRTQSRIETENEAVRRPQSRTQQSSTESSLTQTRSRTESSRRSHTRSQQNSEESSNSPTDLPRRSDANVNRSRSHSHPREEVLTDTSKRSHYNRNREVTRRSGGGRRKETVISTTTTAVPSTTETSSVSPTSEPSEVPSTPEAFVTATDAALPETTKTKDSLNEEISDSRRIETEEIVATKESSKHFEESRVQETVSHKQAFKSSTRIETLAVPDEPKKDKSIRGGRRFESKRSKNVVEDSVSSANVREYRRRPIPERNTTQSAKSSLRSGSPKEETATSRRTTARRAEVSSTPATTAARSRDSAGQRSPFRGHEHRKLSSDLKKKPFTQTESSVEETVADFEQHEMLKVHRDLEDIQETHSGDSEDSFITRSSQQVVTVTAYPHSKDLNLPSDVSKRGSSRGRTKGSDIINKQSTNGVRRSDRVDQKIKPRTANLLLAPSPPSSSAENSVDESQRNKVLVVGGYSRLRTKFQPDVKNNEDNKIATTSAPFTRVTSRSKALPTTQRGKPRERVNQKETTESSRQMKTFSSLPSPNPAVSLNGRTGLKSRSSTTRENYPQKLTTSSENYPNNFPTSSENYPKRFPTSSENYPKRFPTSSENYPKRFPTSSENYPRRFPTSSENYSERPTTMNENYPPDFTVATTIRTRSPFLLSTSRKSVDSQPTSSSTSKKFKTLKETKTTSSFRRSTGDKTTEISVVTSQSVPSNVPRFSSRYRTDLLRATGLRTTTTPVYVPTVPTVRPTISTSTAFPEPGFSDILPDALNLLDDMEFSTPPTTWQRTVTPQPTLPPPAASSSSKKSYISFVTSSSKVVRSTPSSWKKSSDAPATTVSSVTKRDFSKKLSQSNKYSSKRTTLPTITTETSTLKTTTSSPKKSTGGRWLPNILDAIFPSTKKPEVMNAETPRFPFRVTAAPKGTISSTTPRVVRVREVKNNSESPSTPKPSTTASPGGHIQKIPPKTSPSSNIQPRSATELPTTTDLIFTTTEQTFNVPALEFPTTTLLSFEFQTTTTDLPSTVVPAFEFPTTTELLATTTPLQTTTFPPTTASFTPPTTASFTPPTTASFTPPTTASFTRPTTASFTPAPTTSQSTTPSIHTALLQSANSNVRLSVTQASTAPPVFTTTTTLRTPVPYVIFGIYPNGTVFRKLPNSNIKEQVHQNEIARRNPYFPDQRYYSTSAPAPSSNAPNTRGFEDASRNEIPQAQQIPTVPSPPQQFTPAPPNAPGQFELGNNIANVLGIDPQTGLSGSSRSTFLSSVARNSNLITTSTTTTTTTTTTARPTTTRAPPPPSTRAPPPPSTRAPPPPSTRAPPPPSTLKAKSTSNGATGVLDNFSLLNAVLLGKPPSSSPRPNREGSLANRIIQVALSRGASSTSKPVVARSPMTSPKPTSTLRPTQNPVTTKPSPKSPPPKPDTKPESSKTVPKTVPKTTAKPAPQSMPPVRPNPVKQNEEDLKVLLQLLENAEPTTRSSLNPSEQLLVDFLAKQATKNPAPRNLRNQQSFPNALNNSPTLVKTTRRPQPMTAAPPPGRVLGELFSPVPVRGQSDNKIRDPRAGQSLVEAAINATKAVSQLMGSVIQGATKSFQSFMKSLAWGSQAGSG